MVLQGPHRGDPTERRPAAKGSLGVATTEVGRLPARLELPGAGTRDARVEVIYQPRATRLTRTLLILGVTVALMPVVFFIPPHLLWPIVVLAAGVYFAHKYWKGEYYVSTFEGACPRCDTELDLKPGSRIRSRQTLECYGCHRQPELVLDPNQEPDSDPAGGEPEVDRRIYEDRRSGGSDRRGEPKPTPPQA